MLKKYISLFTPKCIQTILIFTDRTHSRKRAFPEDPTSYLYLHPIYHHRLLSTAFIFYINAIIHDIPLCLSSLTLPCDIYPHFHMLACSHVCIALYHIDEL